jgi:hypothetical protein
MNHLADDMERLHGEIINARDKRRMFIQDTINTVSDIKNDVAGMLNSFQQVRMDMFMMTKAERQAFLSRIKDSVFELKKSTTNLRKEFIADIAGAHHDWFGKNA